MQAVRNMFGGDAKRTDGVHETGADHFQETGLTPGAHTGVGPTEADIGLGHSDVVGLPDVAHGTGHVQYQDAHISTESKNMAVSHVRDAVVSGDAIAMEERAVRVPRTEMRMETVMVPDVRLETDVVQMPETVIVQTPEIVKDVETVHEQVTREQVVLDQEVKVLPTTEMRSINVDKPTVRQRAVMVARPNEIMRKVTVVRPEDVLKRVTIQVPVERTRRVMVKRPFLVKKLVTVERPVPVVDVVNVTQPEIQDATMDVQVPVTENVAVEYEQPVTQIRPTEAQTLALERQDNFGAVEDSFSIDREVREHTTRDWSTIPIGLPFTELQRRTKEFQVTSLRTEQANIRQTWMMTKQYQKKDYRMERVEVEVTETEWREVEEEIIETVLEEQSVEVEVSIMHEVAEEWPVTKGREESITTSEVTLEPTTAVMPQLGMKEVTVDVPRKEVITETIEKAVPVERTVMVDKSVTQMREVAVERPVEYQKEVQVERPHTVYDEVLVQQPVTVREQVHVQRVEDEHVAVKEENAHFSTKDVAYRTAGTVMEPTVVGGNYNIHPSTQMADVSTDEVTLARQAAERTKGLMTGADYGTTHTAATTGTGAGVSDYATAGTAADQRRQGMIVEEECTLTHTQRTTSADLMKGGRNCSQELSDSQYATGTGHPEKRGLLGKIKHVVTGH